MGALPINTIKKIIAKYNKQLDIRGYGKLKKPELIAAVKAKKPMDKTLLAKLTREMENERKKRGDTVKAAPKKAEPKKEAPKKEPPKIDRYRVRRQIASAAADAGKKRARDNRLKEIEANQKKRKEKADAKKKVVRISKEQAAKTRKDASDFLKDAEKKGKKVKKATKATKDVKPKPRPVQGPRNLKKGFGIRRLPKEEKKAPAAAAKKPIKFKVNVALNPKTTPPVLPVNEANAKKILAYMTKMDRENSAIDEPALGKDYYDFKFESLKGGDLNYISGGRGGILEIKKIMKFLKEIKSGKIDASKIGTFLLPKYYQKYLEAIGRNPKIGGDQLLKSGEKAEPKAPKKAEPKAPKKAEPKAEEGGSKSNIPSGKETPKDEDLTKKLKAHIKKQGEPYGGGDFKILNGKIYVDQTQYDHLGDTIPKSRADFSRDDWLRQSKKFGIEEGKIAPKPKETLKGYTTHKVLEDEDGKKVQVKGRTVQIKGKIAKDRWAQKPSVNTPFYFIPSKDFNELPADMRKQIPAGTDGVFSTLKGKQKFKGRLFILEKRGLVELD